MKICTGCKISKPLEDFTWDTKSRKSARCKECKNSYARSYYSSSEVYRDKVYNKQVNTRSRLQSIVDDYKKEPCTDCGVFYPPYVMDFDHLKDKKADISLMVRSQKSQEEILEEISKCELVCSNCHRIRTHNRRVSGAGR